jgi:alanyl aminopeptidase
MFREKSCPRLLVSLALVTAFALLPGVSSAKDVRLGTNVVPTFQAVELELDASTADYTGSVRVDLLVRKETKVFRFHAEAMELESVTLVRDKELLDLTYEVGEKGVVTVTTKYTLPPGEYKMGIAFNDDFNTDAVALYRMEKDGLGYSFTQFEADDAREAFPCWDEPMFKIPYQMTLTVPGDHLAVTNTPIESETTLEDGRKRIVFMTTKPMPSYLLAIATGPLETVEIPGLDIPGRIVTVKGQSHLAGFAIDTTPPILAALEEYFGSKYPYKKLDMIAIPEYWPGAMENPGAITWSDGLLLLDPKTASVGQKRFLVRVNAHELAHMWFGDLVTMKWWDDLWLNESFADWMGDKIAHQVYPQYKQNLSSTREMQGIMFEDARPSTTPIRRPIESTDNLLEDVGLAYDKGKAVLAMFEQWLGEEAFRNGVVNYINDNAWGNATAADFWKHLDKASGKKLSPAMATFIDQPGVPMISLEIQGKGKVRLSQKRFHNYGTTVENLTWHVPVGIKYSIGGQIQTQTFMLDKKLTTIDLGSDVDWILPNLEAHGYYRWSVPSEMLQDLASSASQNLTARERIAFISNLGSLVLAGGVGGDEYLRSMTYFSEDREPLVLSTMIASLDGVKEAFVPEEEEEVFAVYVSQTLGPAMKWCGFEATPDEDETMSLIRPRLIAWLGDDGRDEKVMAFAKNQAKAYLEDPSSVDPSIAGVAISLAAHEGDQALFDEYKKRAEETQIPTERRRFLGALGSFRNPGLQEETLRYAIEGPVRPQEMFQVSMGIGTTSAGRERVYRWMTENYDTIVGRIPPVFASFMTMFAGGCSEERLANAHEFFGRPEHQVAGTDKQLAKVSDQVNDCLGLREREGEAVSRYLHELNHGTGDD